MVRRRTTHRGYKRRGTGDSKKLTEAQKKAVGRMMNAAKTLGLRASIQISGYGKRRTMHKR